MTYCRFIICVVNASTNLESVYIETNDNHGIIRGPKELIHEKFEVKNRVTRSLEDLVSETEHHCLCRSGKKSIPFVYTSPFVRRRRERRPRSPGRTSSPSSARSRSRSSRRPSASSTPTRTASSRPTTSRLPSPQ
jgi:hypothetical protein